ncbi:chromosome segregation protein SMC [bacterium LRH843]|nr:chromosome segregation protein SMC [bacterium LRH843]
MFLKRLEVVGFKSFAEQINIEFVPGVTAVVGPNGSGKSNISDSIRWVLGEQSAKSLRGSKMEDIIFAGSDSRKPLNYAEVTLVLENDDHYLSIDYSEVSVTRRVFRSGDSEYLINKQPCRLKDIVDLFLDSGLGKEAYSIIGQGKVEEILSNKAEDRRVIFEEAAGVLKYKNRKTTAQKRLIETQENLFRVEDILHELEDQVEPLQIQASIAKDYLHKRAELKEVDIALLAHEIKELHMEWESEKDKLASARKQYTMHNEKLDEMEKQRLLLRDRTANLAVSYNAAQEELLKTSEELEKNDGKRKVLDERKKHATANKEQVERLLTEKSEQLERTTNEWQQEQDHAAKEGKLFKELEVLVEKKQHLLRRADVNKEEEIDQLKSDYIEILNEQASIRNERRYLEEQRRQQELKQERLLSENNELLNSREKLIQQFEQVKKEASEKEQKWERMGTVYRSRQKELESLKKHYQQKETKLYESYQLMQRLQSRADVLEEMQADFSGFFQGVKAVLKARGRLTGVLGAVAELVQVPKEYETALEIAFGGASQHIVMASEADARKAIHYLKQNRIGRATFLPLPVMKPRTIQDFYINQLEGHAAFVGIAATLLSFDEKYNNVLFHLLGHVIIATHLEGANELARMTGHKFRIVTLDGDVVNPGGSMTGGSVKQQQTPLLGRKRELLELQEKLVKLTKVAALLEQEVKQLKEKIKEEEGQLELLRTQIEDARHNVLEEKGKVRDLSREIERAENEYARFDRDKSGFADEINRIDRRLAELETAYQKAVSGAGQLEEAVKQLEKEQVELHHSRETLQEELVADKIALAAARERYAAVKERLDRLVQAKSVLEEERLDLQDQYNFLVGEVSDRANGENGNLEEQIHKSRLRKQELMDTIAAMKRERGEVDQLYAGLEQSLKKQQSDLSFFSNECLEIEVKVNRLDVELDSRLHHLREEYELTFEAASAQYELTIDPEEAKTKVKLIKLGIEELGTVNLGAIEEYERVRERFTFLSEQRNDLHHAKETLNDVIEEMDQEMSRRFYETYSQIRVHFQKVFKQLFGGGEADLILTEPNNLLETGVEIIARPLGKKMQNLSLLSGGERALTAIGLLFAILYVRPVPFCVLDEVEAALDEANVSRFAQFLKDFSLQTQFIVITHRKGTMEEADVLYGVTMQESGVSRLVSVRLEETKELIES